MFFDWWRKVVRVKSKVSRSERRKPLQRRPSFKPCVEVLEDRLAPASFTVIDPGDSLSPGTLRCAITQVNADATSNGDSITFDPTVFKNPTTITLSNGRLELSRTAGPVSIDGVGQVTLSGNRARSVFEVDQGVEATLTGLKIQDGNATDGTNGFTQATAGNCGGGIFNAGALTLTNSILTSNHADGGKGGAVYNAGTLTVDSSLIGWNNVYDTNGASGGGAIYNAGALTVNDSTLSGNGSSYYGGGICNEGVLTVSNSTLSDNHAYNGGGAISNAQYGTLTVSNSTLSGNFAMNGSGGGIYNLGALMVSYCTISRNASYQNFDLTAPQAGGGVVSGPDVELQSSIVAGNLGSVDVLSDFYDVSSHNLIGSASGVFGLRNGDSNGNQVGSPAAPFDPLLAPLANYGGPTQTFALLPGSPAQGKGGRATILSTKIDSIQTTLSVTDLTPGILAIPIIPAGSLIRIDAEQLLVTAVNGETLTVQRGVNGTTPASHSGGAAVYLGLDQRGVPRLSGANPDIGAFQGTLTKTLLQKLIDATPPTFGTAKILEVNAASDLAAHAWVSLAGSLDPQDSPLFLELVLAPGLYTDVTVNLPPARGNTGITLDIRGKDSGSTIIEGFSPALTVISGNVVVTGVTLTTATDSPTVLVQGGSLQLSHDSVQQTSTGSVPAITVQAGSVALGGNNINVNGRGPWVDNQTTTQVLPAGDTFQIAGVTQTAPHAFADNYTLGEKSVLSVSALGVLGNDLDPSGELLTAILASGPANGILLLNPDGSFTYTPNANFAGTDYFTYQAKNTDGTLSNPATVTLNVQVVASQLVLSGLPSSTDLNVSQSFTVTAEDSSLRVATGYMGTVHFTSTDAQATQPSDYTFTSSDNGSHTFTPGITLASAGNRAIIASDTGNSTITGTATVFVNPRNVYWSGFAGDGNWDNAENWSLNPVPQPGDSVLPGPNDAVTIDNRSAANPFTVTHSAGADSVYSLTAQDAITVWAGSLSFATPSTISNRLALGGTLLASADLTVTGQFQAFGGVLRGSGGASPTLTLDGGGQADGLAVDGCRVVIAAGQAVSLPSERNYISLRHGASIDNYGTLLLSGVLAQLNGDSSGTLNNYGTLLSGGGGEYVYGMRVNNPGAIELQQGDLTFGYVGDTEVDNSGTVDVQAGMLTIVGSYTQFAGSTILDGGNISGALAIQGGVLKGTGTVYGSVTNGGQVSPDFSPGLITVQGDYTQTSTGDFVAEIHDPNAGTDYDQVAVTGAVTLAGNLQVSLLNGFIPPLGASFTILDNKGPGAVRGAFTGLPDGATVWDSTHKYSFTISYAGGDGNDVTLTANALPPAVAVTGPAAGVAAQVLTFNLTATDPSPADQAGPFTYGIDWDGNGTVDQTVSGPARLSVTHAFAAAGIVTISVTATDMDGRTSAPAVLPVQVNTLAPGNLASVLTPGGLLLFHAATPQQAHDFLAAANGLAAATTPAAILVLDLGGQTVTDSTANVPPQVTLVMYNGAFVGGSPALVVQSGQVIVRDSTFTNATDAPTILVSGGSLTLRGDTVQESTGYDQTAISVIGGALDLGTAADPGYNTLNVNGAGVLVANNTANPVAAAGDAFLINGAPLAPDSLSGIAFEDFNDDGQIDFGEKGIAGVKVTLSGKDFLGNAVTLSTVTDADGAYVFANLLPGNYYLTETQPAGYNQGVDSIGTAGGSLSATDQFFVQLAQGASGVNGLNYNFGEQPAASGPVQKGQTAGIGFWNNKNGQALIKAFNGGVGTQLADWLAATLPNIFGVKAGIHNLAGKSNAYVAALFQQDFLLKGVKLDAQLLATALNVYATNATLDSTKAATQYGFVVQGDGVGAASVNIGSNGDAFGVANNSVLTVLDLLKATDAQAVWGRLYNGDAAKRNEANAVYSAVNQAGGL